ncbi:hypothetical protein GCM10020256_05930 [Streptomyces thermocoprophilus]
MEASDTRVMVVTGTATTFLDASTGKSVGPSLDASATMGAGSLRHPAAYADGVFYLLCDTPKEMGLLAAFDAARGKSKWVAHVSGFGTTGDGREAYFGSTFVAVAGDTVYVCGRLTGSGVSSVDGPTTGFIRAFDAATGKTLWRTEGTDINNVLVPPSGTSLLATSAVPGKPALVQMINAGRKGARGWKLSAPKSAYYFNTGWPLTCYAAGTFFICGGRGRDAARRRRGHGPREVEAELRRQQRGRGQDRHAVHRPRRHERLRAGGQRPGCSVHGRRHGPVDRPSGRAQRHGHLEPVRRLRRARGAGTRSVPPTPSS